jgi:hypothetical protein
MAAPCLAGELILTKSSRSQVPLRDGDSGAVVITPEVSFFKILRGVQLRAKIEPCGDSDPSKRVEERGAR